MFEMIKARFLVPAAGNDIKLTAHGLSLGYASFDEHTEAVLYKEAEEWVISHYSYYCYENDDYDSKDESSSTTLVPLTEMISLSSGAYTTDKIRGDILVLNGKVAGVVLYVMEQGGNGWSNYKSESFTILHTNGRVDGKACSYYSFSGESSSRVTEDRYTLKKKKA